MAGIFSRKVYDDCFIDEKTAMSVGGLYYRVFPDYGENPGKCLSNNGPRSSHRGPVTGGDLNFRTGVENYLHNLDIPDSRCLSVRNLADKEARLQSYLKENAAAITQAKICGSDIDISYTRQEANNADVRTFAVNRLHFPLFSNEEQVFYGIKNTEQIGSDRNGVNTRLRLKDELSRK